MTCVCASSRGVRLPQRSLPGSRVGLRSALARVMRTGRRDWAPSRCSCGTLCWAASSIMPRPSTALDFKLQRTINVGLDLIIPIGLTFPDYETVAFINVLSTFDLHVSQGV